MQGTQAGSTTYSGDRPGLSTEHTLGRPSDHALWASVVATLRDVVLPELGDGFARQSALQLIGVAIYARDRGPDPSHHHEQELSDALDALDEVSITLDLAPDGPDPWVRAASLLAAASGREDEAAVEVASTLRTVLVGQLDRELAAHQVLVDAFRGRVE